MRRNTSAYLGTLGNRDGINVARVEVAWSYDGEDAVETGHYHVHATGDEPEAQGEDGTIYNVFEDLVHEAMQRRQERLGFASYEIEDTSSI
jgi:hypothetical protein